MSQDCMRNMVPRFASDARGNVAMLLGLLAVPLVSAIGLSVDYARAVAYQNKLEAAASASTIAGVDMMRAMLAADPNAPTSKVKAAAEEATEKMFLARKPGEASVTMESVSVARDGDTITAKLAYSASVPTLFAGLINKPTMDISGGNTSTGPTAAVATKPTGDPNVIFTDYFKVPQPPLNGMYGVVTDYNGWRLPPGGLEMNGHEIYKTPPSPGGGLLVELDKDQNGSMARKMYLSAGNYDLRYFVRDRVSYAAYDPVYLCGIDPNEYNWANATGVVDGMTIEPQSNRIGVYLERVVGDDPPAVFPSKESDTSLIDMCMSTGGRWIERRVRIVVQTPANFWLAFQAEGPSDGYGALLGGMKLCRESCSGENAPMLEIFPWEARQTLFEDSFNTPTPKSGGLDTTLDQSGVGTGWATPPPRGWTTTPINSVDHHMVNVNGVDTMGVELDASYLNRVAPEGDEPSSKRAIHRKFLLAPGLYGVTYRYASAKQSAITAIGDYCGVEQEASNMATVGSATSRLRIYMDTHMLHSVPAHKPGLRSVATWLDGNGGPPTSPRIGSQMVHGCVYSSSPTERRFYLRIMKSAEYWLTLSADDDEPIANQRGPIITYLQIRAIGGRSTADPTGYLTTEVKYRGRLSNTVRNSYYVRATTQ